MVIPLQITLFITVGEKYSMLYYLHLIYPTVFIFLLGFITNQQQQLTVFLLITLNFQIM